MILRKITLLLALIVSATTLFAQSRLHDLEIRVVLSKDGDARITEIRRMIITSEGTECYIPIGNTGRSMVTDLTVSDEQGKEYTPCDVWDVNWDREKKTGKCGILEKSSGYELCWGLGAPGERTYTASYTLTGLVRSYEESDGFNWMFVARDVKPSPEHVKLTITTDYGTLLTDSIANIWAFGYGGDIIFTDSAIVAETTEPFKEHDAMIVMCEFNKGVFSPWNLNYKMKFESVKKCAFEGSDYLEEEKKEDKDPWWMTWLEWICGGGLVFLALCGLVWEPVARLVYKFKFRNVDWYRDIPLGGDLSLANHLMNEVNQQRDYDKLLSASVLKLVQMGALGIDQQRPKPAFVINEWKTDAQVANRKLLESIYTLFKHAAGDNQVLDPHELKNYMESEKHWSEVYSFVNILHEIHLDSLSDNKTEVNHLLGLKKFLKDFTLIDEREVQEVTLWKDYMVWATLFGIASTVVEQMKKINPEYFKMDNIASQLAYSVMQPEVTKVFANATASAYYRDLSDSTSSSGGSRRSSGGGGHASRGGGGGYHGGGSGGGIR